jgi:PIN domain nuclease of toxin-antitoxin system
LIAAVADTHTALWHLFDDDRLSLASRDFMQEAARQRQKIAVSTISFAELVYLTEKGRLPPVAYSELVHALANSDHLFIEASFTAPIVEAMKQVARSEVPDMPDRIISATAIYLKVPVISRDRRIRSANLNTIW